MSSYGFRTSQGAGMKCRLVDYRTDFGSILAEKLGREFSLENAGSEENSDYDVMVVSVPPTGDPAFADQLAAVTRAARTVEDVPVVALLPASDRGLSLRVLAEGAYDCFVETSSLEELRIILRRAAQFRELSREMAQLRKSPDAAASFTEIITTTEKMK